jgi:hypothetical protein
MLYRVHLARVGFKLTTLVVIGTDCIRSYKSNYHMIMTMTAPSSQYNFKMLHVGVTNSFRIICVCQWLATGWWFYSVSSTNNTERHDITEILLKVYDHDHDCP